MTSVNEAIVNRHKLLFTISLLIACSQNYYSYCSDITLTLARPNQLPLLHGQWSSVVIDDAGSRPALGMFELFGRTGPPILGGPPF